MYSYDRRPSYSYDRRVAIQQLTWSVNEESSQYTSGLENKTTYVTRFKLTATVPNPGHMDGEHFEIEGSARTEGDDDAAPTQTLADVKTWNVALYVGRGRRPQGYVTPSGKLQRLPKEVGSLNEAKKLAEVYLEKRAAMPTDPAVIAKLLTKPQKKLILDARQNNNVIPEAYIDSRASRTFLTRTLKTLEPYKIFHAWGLSPLGKEIAALLA